mmetsp:Transcript_4723/g.5774  ORF Transcript_4723/g.5774 Transcript_4723/m.5774 type:complete len:135 (+) Transcript_4723:231-635(+)
MYSANSSGSSIHMRTKKVKKDSASFKSNKSSKRGNSRGPAGHKIQSRRASSISSKDIVNNILFQTPIDGEGADGEDSESRERRLGTIADRSDTLISHDHGYTGLGTSNSEITGNDDDSYISNMNYRLVNLDHRS